MSLVPTWKANANYKYLPCMVQSPGFCGVERGGHSQLQVSVDKLDRRSKLSYVKVFILNLKSAVATTSNMEEYANARQAILSSLFQKYDANGQSEETYVGHVKIWEDVPAGVTQLSEAAGMKPRYVIVASASPGTTMHPNAQVGV